MSTATPGLHVSAAIRPRKVEGTVLSFPSGRLRFCLFSWYIRRVIRGPLYVAMMTVQSTSFSLPCPGQSWVSRARSSPVSAANCSALRVQECRSANLMQLAASASRPDTAMSWIALT